MFLNVQAFDSDDNLIYEVNPYDYSAGTLKGKPASPALSGTEAIADELVYEVHSQSSLTGEQATFHIVLADGRSKDNRIPPKGFDVVASVERVSEPVNPVTHASDLSYYTAAEYAGGYDEQLITIVPLAARVELVLYYQGTSREFVEFLRDEINGTGNTTLTSPTPSGEAQAYVIQTDPFFAQLKAWGDTIWALWWHNHGLDGVGAALDGIVPFAMAEATYNTPSTPLVVDPVVLPTAIMNVTYPQRTLTATNGQAPYTWAIVGGSLPPGMSLTAAGVVGGKPTAAGTWNFTVQATDAVSATATLGLPITVKTGRLFPGYFGPCGICHSAAGF